MANITVSTKYSEREEFVYCFTLMSDIYQANNYYQNDQLPKLVASIQKELKAELKDFLYLLPLFCYKSYNLSLFSNCRRLFIPETEDLILSAEVLISKVLTDDSVELTARVFMTADNNTNDITFYRLLISESLEAVKYCLKMDIDEELRTILLSLLVEHNEYHKKMTEFAFKTLYVLRHIFEVRDFAIKKLCSAFDNGTKIIETLLKAGYINNNDNVIVTPILLNPGVIYQNRIKGVKYFKLGIDYEEAANIAIGTVPTVELENIGKIFGDTTRCEIIRILKNGGLYLTELARRLNIPTNSLHYHIQTLIDYSVINGRYNGKRFIYELNPRFFKTASTTLVYFSH